MKLRRVAVLAGVACVSLPLVELSIGVHAARADTTPGSGLLAYGLSATAPGSQWTEDRPLASSHPEFEGEAPESIAQLQTGGQGYALSSIAWPGPIVANAGTTSQLLNLGLPSSSSQQLNEPVRAEARTGSGPSTVTNNTYPGSSMTATATPTDVESDATMSGTSGPAPQSHTGNTETFSVAQLTGPSTGIAKATSTVQDISLAGGAITIGSITSKAQASTDAKTATASGATVVSNMKVGGQPAYLDQSGLHLGSTGPGSPVNSVASQLAQQALVGFGMKIAVSQPTKTTNGSQVTYDAGNVVFYWSPPGSQGETMTATFGGASVTVGASPGFNLSTPSTPSPPVGATASAPAISSGSSGPTDTGSLSSPSTPATPSTPGATSGGTTAFTPVSTSAPLRLPRGLSPWWVVLILLGSGLIAFGMRRLPDRVLEQPSTTCPMGGQQ